MVYFKQIRLRYEKIWLRKEIEEAFSSRKSLNLKIFKSPNTNFNFEWRRFSAMGKVITGDIYFRNWVEFAILSPEFAFIVVANRLQFKLRFEFEDFEFLKFSDEDN